MTLLIAYLRLVLFFGGVLVGIQLPMFVDQYGKSLESHYLESQRSVGQFRDEAIRHFGGDMNALIAHYRRSGDPVFRDGGDSLQALYDRNVELEKQLFNFRENLWSAYAQAFFTPVQDVQDEVRKNFSYAIKLDAGAIGFGLASGFLLSIMGELLLRTLAALVLPPRRRTSP